MKRDTFYVTLAVCILMWLPSFLAQAQQASQGGTSVIVPRLIRFGGILKDSAGQPRGGVVGITFGLYRDQEGGAALWLETQNVSLDANGHYGVLLGATKEEGVPMDLFTSGTAQWLGVHVQGQPEQPRVWMVSVPYALKAADAETLGGLPPSAFAPAPKPSNTTNPVSAAPTALTATGVVTTLAPTGSGTPNFIPLWTTSSNLGSSVASQVSGNVGVGFSTPLPSSLAAKLDVNGGAFIRGLLQLPSTGSATSSGGKNSNAVDLIASSFSSSLSQPMNQRFRWQAEPAANNSSSPSGRLNLLYGLGSTTPAETGLSINNAGALTVPGVTLPAVGTASGTNTAGFNSRPLDLFASAWSTSGTPAPVSERFRWQAEPAGSNTTAPSGKLNLLFAAGSGFPVETGLSISSKGLLTFAKGQTFPGTGPGTVTSVGLSAPSPDFTVTGSPVTSTGILDLSWTTAPTSANTTNAIVKRDGLGGFVAGNVTVAGFQAATIGALSSGAFHVIGGANLGAVDGATGVAGYAFGASGNTTGVLGRSDSPTGVGMFGMGSFVGKQAQSIIGTTAIGALGDSNGYGIVATSDNGNALVVVNNNTGDTATIDNKGGGAPLFATGTGGSLFLDANGNLTISGSLNKSALGFMIDHPLDPANMYLHHSGVESPDMMNIYNGNAIFDGNGEAVVELPAWFETLNRDFRYQLTCIGGFAPVYIAQKIQNNRFTIAGGRPGLEVSWQVTGIRQDPYANAHRIPVEEAKLAGERGYYIHPVLYGQPRERSISSAHLAEMMKQAKEKRAQQGRATKQ